MGLTAYNKKRDFNKTSEPKGVIAPKGKRRFVVQEHHASRLHFDLRLEMGGVLKSWAVPKGPSLDPGQRRLAVRTEDHPVKYIDFEGTIPKGNYGAGEMAIWDEGTYELLEGNEPEKAVEDGKIVLAFHGRRLKGEFHLFEMKGEDGQWLLVKSNDKEARPGWKIEQVIDDAGTPESAKIDEKAISAGKRAAFPTQVAPMLATLVDDLPQGDDWVYEIKWDGFRAVCFIRNGVARYSSRNHNDLTAYFKELVEPAGQLPVNNAVIDGEVVALDGHGNPSFQLIQNRTGIKAKAKSTEPAPVVFYAFDLLYINGKDISTLPLLERKQLLKELLKAAPQNGLLRYSEHFQGEKAGRALLKQAQKEGLEGIIAKRTTSKYVHKRSAEWLKIKLLRRQEAVIGGFTRPRSSRKYFGALVLGLYEGNDLKYVGHTGGGFNSKSLKDVNDLLEPFVTEKCPFDVQPATNEPATWVKPSVVCEVKFTEWTHDRIMRHPIFLGLRPDKKPTECRYEMAQNTTAVLREEKSTRPRPKRDAASTGSASKKIPDAKKVLNEDKLSGDIVVQADGHELKLSHVDKVYWPDEGITKVDLLRYYANIAHVLLPHLKDRPLILQRYPDGYGADMFYQHDMKTPPPFMETFVSREKDKTIHYAVCNNLASLLYLVNYGVIAQHPFHSRTAKIDHPDWIVFDLDPGDVSYSVVCDVALCLHAVLEKLGLEAYAKTSGASGMHVFLPLGARYDYEQCAAFAQLVSATVERMRPDIVTTARMIRKRPKKSVYLDAMQNGEGKSVASVWSVRAYAGATVSTPLTWKEVNGKPSPAKFDLLTASKRAAKGDLFAPVLKRKQSIAGALKKLEKWWQAEEIPEVP